jgi:hypothetical protein
MSVTPRLEMPFLSAGQAQKEFFHNEALQTLDALVAGAVEEGPRSAPPSAPAVGACYILGTSPTGVWAGRSQFVAAFTSGGWRFLTPVEGMTLYVKSSGTRQHIAWARGKSGIFGVQMSCSTGNKSSAAEPPQSPPPPVVRQSTFRPAQPWIRSSWPFGSTG